MNILGIGFNYYHDPAACLVKDDQMVAVAEDADVGWVELAKPNTQMII